MKEKTILKMMLILIMGVISLTIPITALAVTGNATDLDDLFSDYEDQGKKDDLTDEESKADASKDETTTTTTTTNTTTTDTNKDKTTTTTNNTNKETTNNNIPKAGIEENTMGIVTIVVLGITAVYAYKKIKEFKNI